MDRPEHAQGKGSSNGDVIHDAEFSSLLSKETRANLANPKGNACAGLGEEPIQNNTDGEFGRICENKISSTKRKSFDGSKMSADDYPKQYTSVAQFLASALPENSRIDYQAIV